MSAPKLTVLIPTRDRCATLMSTLRSCLAQDYPHFRVIVSDNCSTDGTAEMVGSISDARLHYVRTPRRLSMTGNFEFSLSLVDDGYLMHLGDDDGLVLGGAAEVARIIAETGAEAVNSAHTVYHWPSSLYAGYANRLILPRGRGWHWVSGLEAARAVIDFDRGYPYLPSTYSGFVARRVIDRVAGGGAYYSSITPDSYAGFANAGVLDRYIHVRRPFAIAGLSGRSNGGSNVNAGDGSEADRYLAENDLPTHADVAYSPKSIPLVVAEAFLQACERVPRLYEINFDVKRLCEVALRDAPADHYATIRDAVIQTAARHRLVYRVPPAPTVPHAIAREADRMRVRIRRLCEGYRRIDAAAHGVSDVAGAGRLASELLGPPER